MADRVNGWSLPGKLQPLALTGGHGKVTELAAIFKREAACRLDLLRNALSAGDYSAVAIHAGAIKGSAILIDAASLITTCRHLELDAAHHVTENLERLLLEAEAELKAFDVTTSRIAPLANTAGQGQAES